MTFDEDIFEKKTVHNIMQMLALVMKLRRLRTHYHYKTIVILDRHWIF